VKTPGTEADGPTLPGGRGIARGKIQDDIMRVPSAEPSVSLAGRGEW
jgi:hypothetical protein